MSDVQPPADRNSVSATPAEEEFSHLGLSEQLRNLLDPEARKDLTIKGLLQAIDERAFGLLLVILSLPSALPVPAAGYSVPFGICLLILAFQMIRGQERPAFPEKFQKVSIGYGFAEKMIGAANKFLKLFERFIKPRYPAVTGPAGKKVIGVIVAIMGILMMIPIPSTNTFPAMVIFLMGVGLCEEDGALVGLGLLVGILAVLLYATLIYFAITLGWEFFDFAKDWVKALISGEPLPSFLPAETQPAAPEPAPAQ